METDSEMFFVFLCITYIYLSSYINIYCRHENKKNSNLCLKGTVARDLG
jgi:hypothetical protein